MSVALKAFASEEVEQLRRVMEAYQECYGSEYAANRLNSVTLRGTQLQGGVEYDFLLRKKQPESMRLRLSHGTASVICGYNGEDGWRRIECGGKVTIQSLSGVDLEVLRREADFNGLLLRAYQDEGFLQLLGTKLVNGRTA